MGNLALDLLKADKPPTPQMESVMDEVCKLAASKNVSLLPGAEEEITNTGIYTWTRALQRKYNSPTRATMYTTYQAYLKSTPIHLAKDLAAAQRDGYLIGVKLVRGAYLNSEPRNAIWDTIEGTHNCYDKLAEGLLTKQYNDMLKPLHGNGSEAFPPVNLVLATHNAESVRRARSIRNSQSPSERVPVFFAQLKGMADEISCELVKAAGTAQKANRAARENMVDTQVDAPKAYKNVCWGTTGQCLNYLLRRAAENKDAAGRTEDTRRAMQAELSRRLKTSFGLA